MTKEIWINLPVKDVKKSKAFFTEIGFSFNEQQSTDQSACMLVGSKNTVVMLFAESMFKGFIGGAPVADANQGNEVLFSFDAESRQEVDELAKKVTGAGGTLYGKPAESQGWLYGFGFVDMDGHRWNVLHMDFSKMPK
jgi:predicted lactoylglutathione lyase